MRRISHLRLLFGITSLLCVIITSTTTFATGYQINNPFDFLSDNNRKRNKPANENEPTMKAWHCHGRTQWDLVDRLRQARIVKSLPVQQVMEQVDRQYYVATTNGNNPLENNNNNPYMDTPQGIYKSQTISAPHMHGHVLEEILPTLERNAERKKNNQGVKILDVGCGSGYLTACFGRWFKPLPDTNNGSILPFPGKVYGMDIHRELVQFTRQNIAKKDGDLLESASPQSGPTITLKHGNGWLGWPEEAPFDAIHVGAAADSFPIHLAQQLALNGVLIVPVGPVGQVQTLLKVERVATTENSSDFVWDDFQVTQLLGVRYVPLVSRPK